MSLEGSHNTRHVPYSQRCGLACIDEITILTDDLSRSEETAIAIASALEAAHRVRDFQIYKKAACIQAQDRTQTTLTLLLRFTAAISLAAGYVGIDGNAGMLYLRAPPGPARPPTMSSWPHIGFLTASLSVDRVMADYRSRRRIMI